MPKYFKVPVNYLVAGYLIVEASTEGNAIDKAYDMGLADVHSKEYIDGSWNVDYSQVEPFNSSDGILPEKDKVVIEVKGGVADVTSAPDSVEVEIIDHDKR